MAVTVTLPLVEGTITTVAVPVSDMAVAEIVTPVVADTPVRVTGPAIPLELVVALAVEDPEKLAAVLPALKVTGALASALLFPSKTVALMAVVPPTVMEDGLAATDTLPPAPVMVTGTLALILFTVADTVAMVTVFAAVKVTTASPLEFVNALAWDKLPYNALPAPRLKVTMVFATGWPTLSTKWAVIVVEVWAGMDVGAAETLIAAGAVAVIVTTALPVTVADAIVAAAVIVTEPGVIPAVKKTTVVPPVVVPVALERTPIEELLSVKVMVVPSATLLPDASLALADIMVCPDVEIEVGFAETVTVPLPPPPPPPPPVVTLIAVDWVSVVPTVPAITTVPAVVPVNWIEAWPLESVSTCPEDGFNVPPPVEDEDIVKVMVSPANAVPAASVKVAFILVLAPIATEVESGTSVR